MKSRIGVLQVCKQHTYVVCFSRKRSQREENRNVETIPPPPDRAFNRPVTTKLDTGGCQRV